MTHHVEKTFDVLMITQIALSIGFHQLPGLIDSRIKVLLIGE